MEEKIDVIRDTLDLSHEEAQSALNLAEGDLDKALQMREYVERAFLIIRAKFKNRNNEYGIFNLLANSREGEFMDIDSINGQINELNEISLDVSDEILEKTIKRIKNKQKTVKNIDYDLKNMFYPTEIFKLNRLIKDDKREEAERILQEKISDYFEEEVELSSYFKLLTRAQLRQIKPQAEIFADEETELDNEEETNEIEEDESKRKQLRVKLNTIPIVSPTKGKRVADLVEGDRVLIKINDNSQLGRYFKKLLEKSEGMTVATVGRVEYNKDSQRYLIQIDIGPQVFSKIYLEPEIKLALSKVSQDEFLDGEGQSNLIPDFIDDLGPYLILIPLVLIIIILISLIIFI